MKLTGNARWTKEHNTLEVSHTCKDGRACWWSHRADRWRVECPVCHAVENLGDLREAYVKEHGGKLCGQCGKPRWRVPESPEVVTCSCLTMTKHQPWPIL
jgi:hypothetical protein